MTDYSPQEIEQKWQRHWAETRAFEVTEDPTKPKFYCLEMFAYPSGHAHVGHVLAGRSSARLIERCAVKHNHSRGCRWRPHHSTTEPSAAHHHAWPRCGQRAKSAKLCPVHGHRCRSIQATDDSGTCHALEAHTVCTCPAGWGGRRCELDCSGEIDFPDPVLAAADDTCGSQPIARMGEVEDIASMALFLASDESAWVTGTAQVVDGGLILGKPWRKLPKMITDHKPMRMYVPED